MFHLQWLIVESSRTQQMDQSLCPIQPSTQPLAIPAVLATVLMESPPGHVLLLGSGLAVLQHAQV